MKFKCKKCGTKDIRVFREYSGYIGTATISCLHCGAEEHEHSGKLTGKISKEAAQGGLKLNKEVK